MKYRALMAALLSLPLFLLGCDDDDDEPSRSLHFVSEMEIRDANGQTITSASAGENVSIVLLIRNRSDSEATLEFGSTRVSDFLVLNDAGEVVRLWSDDRSFSPTVTTETFEAGERRSFEMSWSGLDDDQGNALSAGEYEIQAWAATDDEDGIDDLEPSPLRSTLKPFEITE
ncbi:hypothetical protein J2T60_002269 [Natronospira proteinivora]|uniref:Intracellular proteinase inhibitor BsuPI domain-containing protein n=1 Tax=Natronospira proteinivora TaxID=1807133 RepID=A0ABT1GAB7_9GAMM|nr:BsuPI-related putative proteinase inhibitor [Natronospira proteinivora]MCP1728269.1 hypothetical protein [Natronospira proteinivora]